VSPKGVERKASFQLEFHRHSFTELQKINLSLKAEVQMLTNSIHELKELNTTLRDEYRALELLHSSLDEKLRKSQTENVQLVERLIKFKAKDAEKLNEENETFLR
jgi:autophagy-related protein 16-1